MATRKKKTTRSKKTERVTKKQILNCLAHIEQWCGYVRDAVNKYDARLGYAELRGRDGGVIPPMRKNCPPKPRPRP
jgi:hypothetical protein